MKLKVCMTGPFTAPAEDDCTLVVFKNGEAVVTPDYEEIFHASCQKYARKYHVYLATCLFESDGFLCTALYNPEGELLGVQRATHLNLDHLHLYKAYDKIEPITTPIGKIFLAVDVDILRPDVLRLAIFEGCDYIISSQMFPLREFNEERILFGARSAAVTNRIPVIHVTPFSAALAVPPELSSDGSGFLCYPTGKPVCAEFDWEHAALSRKVLVDSLRASSCLSRYRSILEK